MLLVLTLAGWVGYWTWSFWLMMDILVWWKKSDAAREIKREIHPFVLYGAMPLKCLHDGLTLYDTPATLTLIWLIDVIWFWLIKNDSDKDDRWKKRRKKAAARVKEVAGRLIVVPVPEPVPLSVRRNT